MFFKRPNARNFVTTTHFRGYNFVTPPISTWKRKKIISLKSSYLSPWIYMQISCFIQSSILTPYVWILSNDLDFPEPNFVTKIPNFISSKGPNKKCFLIRELQMRKVFNWHYVFTQIWYLEQESKCAPPKSFARCDEIMRRDEIRWFDGTVAILEKFIFGGHIVSVEFPLL